MKNLKLVVVFILFFSVLKLHSQTNIVTKKYYLEIPNTVNVPSVIVNNGKISLIFSNNVLTNLFKNYTIKDFKVGFPSAKSPILKIVYKIDCDPKLIDQIRFNYSNYFGKAEEIIPFEELALPNDFGGLNSTLNQSYLNFIRAPEAWDIPAKGDNVVIGIAELINVNHPELYGKSETIDGGSTNLVGHGTEVAVVAAGNTNNLEGIASVGYNCLIKGASGLSLENAILLANQGVRVVNCSFGSCSPTPLPYYQAAVDELWDMGVIVVAAAGNGWGTCTTYGPNAYYYPASLNHVFSVTSIGHRSPINSTTDGNRMDSFENFNILLPAVPENKHYLNNSPIMSYNDKVDLSAPGYNIFYPISANTYSDTGWGTSFAAPLVSGTIGLMFGVNSCLFPDEVESILKLTAVKNDLLTINLPYQGQIGAGRLDTYEAVDMARDMSAPTGTVEVKNRIIDRWDFNLRTSPYEIKMTNNIVSNNATINFTARNNIEILSGDYNPLSGSIGLIDLKIQQTNNVCNTPPSQSYSRESNNSLDSIFHSSTKLYPNPSNGLFSIILNNQHSKDVSVNIFDVLGKSVYDSTTNETTFNINVANIPSGLYFVKLTSESYNETLKFIKN